MQRWFFADEREVCRREPSPVIEPDTPPPLTPAPSGDFQRFWDFCVHMPDPLWPNEYLAVVGNCESLGKWQFERCVRMSRNEKQPDLWRAFDVRISRYHDTEYRYLIMAVDEQSQQQIVRRWETAKQPRVVPAQIVSAPTALPHCRDIFGVFEDADSQRQPTVERGWLTSETIVQFKFYKAPFCFCKEVPPRQLNVRVTPMRVLDERKEKEEEEEEEKGEEEGEGEAEEEEEEEKKEGEKQQSINCKRYAEFAPLDNRGGGGEELEVALSTAFAFNETAQLHSAECNELRPQPKYGNACGREDLLLVHCTVGDFERTAYRIDLYTYSSKAAADEPPYAFGYQHVMPSAFGQQRASGRLKLTVMCATKHRPVGTVQLEYLIVRPAEPPLELSMCTSYARRWQPKYTGLDVGHRGCGKTYVSHTGIVRENTIQSLRLAAESGADLIEFDVQVTKDLVPVLHHDFELHITQRRTEPLRKHDFDKRVLSACQYEELQQLRTSPFGEFFYWYDECLPEGETAEQQPFPLLADVLQAIEPHIGFNIEVKWPQELQKRGRWECQLPAHLDKNSAMDAILAAVWQHAGTRRIVFSTFDPDTCAMLRYKQNRYPVMFLFNGETPDRLFYAEPRCCSLAVAACNARVHELLGIVSCAGELIEDPRRVRLVRSMNLVLFCYGDELDNIDTIDSLKTLGLHGIIYDRIDKLIGKAVPRSIFLPLTSQSISCKYQTKSRSTEEAPMKCL